MKTFVVVSELVRCTIAFPLMIVWLVIHAGNTVLGAAIDAILPEGCE